LYRVLAENNVERAWCASRRTKSKNAWEGV